MTDNNKEFHILGPPGTGKTTYLSKQIRSAADKHGDPAVLVVSFTRAAAAEIAGRVGLQTADRAPRSYGGDRYDPSDDGGPDDGSEAQGDHSSRRVGTLHAICYHQLERPEIAETHAAEWNEQARPDMRITGQGGSKADEPEWSGNTKGGDKIFMKVQQLRARQIPLELWPGTARLFYARWRDWKLDRGLLDFTDLIEVAVRRELSPPAGCKVGIVDEAQDFTRLELALISRWATQLETTVIAYDDDQSLYTFKGAAADELTARLPPKDRIRILSQSYRVPRAVHALANAWVHKISNRVEKEYKPRDFEGEVAYLDEATSRCPNQAIEAIERDLAEGRSVMVLAACGYMLRKTIGQLRARGIPFHNPYSSRRGDWNPLKRNKGAVPVRLETFLKRNVELAPSEGEALLHLWTARELWLIVEHMNADVLAYRGVKTRLKQLASDKETKDEFVEEADFVKPEALPWFSSGQLDPFLGNLLGGKRKAFDYSAEIARRDPAGLVDEPRLTIGTIHSVKGGEADSVYVFPDLSPDGARQWRPSAKGRDDVRRLFYVAFTRARERLTLCKNVSEAAVQWSA
jgi:DNA helicase-2/ATP-dependent DNA helicase PcrA